MTESLPESVPESMTEQASEAAPPRTTPTSGERRGTIQSVERAARILKVLGTGSSRMGVTEIAERLGLAKGTAYGLLRTLEAQELIEQDPETDKYRLGPAMLQLGNAFLDNHELRARSLLWADSLASRVGEAVRVGVLHGSNVLIVHHVFRPDNSVQILEVGASIPWHACALGKAIAAYLPEAPRRALLESELLQLTGRTVTDPSTLEATLAVVAEEGSAVEDEEAIVGEAEIAAPVFDDMGHSVGAIGVVGPVERLVPDGRPALALVAAVRETSRGLSRDMGAGRVRTRGGVSRR
ncbi:MAG: IclR family transcriptional regulator [Actinomycetota bacterium]